MPETIDLSQWMDKLKVAGSRSELFDLLDRFRVLEWTDDERARIAKLYIRLIDRLPEEKAVNQTAQVSQHESESQIDEEVWYEKM